MRADADSPQLAVEVCWTVQPTHLPRSLSTGKPRAWPASPALDCHSDATHCITLHSSHRPTSIHHQI